MTVCVIRGCKKPGTTEVGLPTVGVGSAFPPSTLWLRPHCDGHSAYLARAAGAALLAAQPDLEPQPKRTRTDWSNAVVDEGDEAP